MCDRINSGFRATLLLILPLASGVLPVHVFVCMNCGGVRVRAVHTPPPLVTRNM